MSDPEFMRGRWGKIKFAQMLSAVYAGIGPHRNGANTANGLYLLR